MPRTQAPAASRGTTRPALGYLDSSGRRPPVLRCRLSAGAAGAGRASGPGRVTAQESVSEPCVARDLGMQPACAPGGRCCTSPARPQRAGWARRSSHLVTTQRGMPSCCCGLTAFSMGPSLAATPSATLFSMAQEQATTAGKHSRHEVASSTSPPPLAWARCDSRCNCLAPSAGKQGQCAEEASASISCMTG